MVKAKMPGGFTPRTARHYLSVPWKHFRWMAEGARQFDVRLDDRSFQVGDEVIYNPAFDINFDAPLPIEGEITDMFWLRDAMEVSGKRWRVLRRFIPAVVLLSFDVARPSVPADMQFLGRGGPEMERQKHSLPLRGRNFQAVASYRRRFDIRLRDRLYNVGDLVIFHSMHDLALPMEREITDVMQLKDVSIDKWWWLLLLRLLPDICILAIGEPGGSNE